MVRHKTQEEEEDILNKIEQVANDLSEQVGELQFFLKKLKESQKQITEPIKLTLHERKVD